MVVMFGVMFLNVNLLTVFLIIIDIEAVHDSILSSKPNLTCQLQISLKVDYAQLWCITANRVYTLLSLRIYYL